MAKGPERPTGKSVESAIPVEIGSVTRRDVGPGDDAQFFRIESEGSARVRVFSLGGTDVMGALLDAEGVEVARDDDGGDDFSFRLQAEVDGTRYVQVSSADASFGEYELAVMHERGRPDESGGRSDAVPLEVGDARDARFDGPDDEEDLYVLKLEDGLDARIRSYGALDTMAALLDERGSLLALDDDSGDDRNFLLRPNLAPGIYFLRVRRVAGQGDGG